MRRADRWTCASPCRTIWSIKASDLRTPGAPIGLGALNVTLGGDLRATKAPGEQIVLVGAVNTVRGTYDFQGRRFEILRDGTVRFDGEPLNELNPILDIRTQRLIQGVEARVNVRGTLTAAGDRAQQHAAARTGRHPVADRLQPADQLARRRPADLAGAARAAAGDRRAGRRSWPRRSATRWASTPSRSTPRPTAAPPRR